MIRTDCPCLDCKRNNAIAAAAASAPIHRQPWQDAEPANQAQAVAWGMLADRILDKYGGMSLSYVVSEVCGGIPGLRDENYPRVKLMVERFLRENPKYELRGRAGGIFKRGPAGGTDRSVVYAEPTPRGFAAAVTLIDEMSKAPKEVQDHALRMIKSGTLPPPMPEVVAINDHICPGCGNNKCSKAERTCWKCGGAL